MGEGTTLVMFDTGIAPNYQSIIEKMPGNCYSLTARRLMTLMAMALSVQELLVE